MAGRHRFLVALVIPGRASGEIDGLRRTLATSNEPIRIPPHVTLIPPVNVRGEVAPLIDWLHHATEKSGPIELGIGPIATFAPRNPTVYLAVSGDLVALASLRNRLASGPLLAPQDREPRDFVPHVTLSNQVDPARLSTVLDAFSGYRTTTTITKVTLFEQNLQSRDHRWHAIADVALGPAAVVGRGGRELVFHHSEQLDPVAGTFLKDQWTVHRLTYGHSAEADSSFGLSVWLDGRVVGATSGQFVSGTCELDRFIVASTDRGIGIGGQLLGRLERLARDHGAARIRMRISADSAAESFFAHYGYVRTALLEDWRGGRDFVILSRTIADSSTRSISPS